MSCAVHTSALDLCFNCEPYRLAPLNESIATKAMYTPPGPVKIWPPLVRVGAMVCGVPGIGVKG